MPNIFACFSSGLGVLSSAMAGEKPLTKSDLIAALREFGVATKKDVDDAIHNQLTEFYTGYIKPEFEKLHLRIGNVEDEVREVKTELSWVKSEIIDLKADLAVPHPVLS